MATCQQIIITEVDSIAVGPQEVPHVCNQPLTQRVFVNGGIIDMCDRCANNTVNEFGGRLVDASAAVDKLCKLSIECAAVALELAPWPDIAYELDRMKAFIDQMTHEL